MLALLGLTEADVVQGGSYHQTFQAFDSYGNLYNDAYVNEEGVVVNADGVAIEGAYINEEGNAVDAYGNVTELENKVENLDPKADNPDIASPPEKVDDGTGGGTTWDGITDEDLKQEEE